MAKLTEYPAGTPFPGAIGRTVDESSPAWPSPNRTKEGTPNVLFIVIDDTGFGQLGAYGGLVKTPNIDKFAQGGLKYTDVHTTAICSATHHPPARLCSGCTEPSPRCSRTSWA